MRAKFASLGAALMMAASLIVLPASAAQAASCSGYGCDGAWPDQSGCASTAITGKSKKIYNNDGLYIGLAELRYSTACRTAWGRIQSFYENGSGQSAWITRNSDNKQYSCNSNLWADSLGSYSCYTRMVYDGGVTSYVQGSSPYSAFLYTVFTDSY